MWKLAFVRTLGRFRSLFGSEPFGSTTIPSPRIYDNNKLRRGINLLEGKLQQAVNENAKLKVKQTEDSKLWQGLDSKVSSTKTLCDQLTETLQQLARQTEQAREDKKFFEEMFGKNSKALDEFNCLSHDLSTKLDCAEQKIISGKQDMLRMKQEKEEMDQSYKEQLYSNDTTIKEKEKLVKEQASVKTDLEMAHTKLRRATEQINLLQGKLQQAKVKQTEDSKLWQGLDSKVSSTKTLCDQLTETLQQLARQTEQAREDKKFFEEMFGKNSKALDEFNCLSHDLSTKLDCAEQKIISGKQDMLRMKQEKEEMDQSYKEQLYSNDTTINEKDSLIKQLECSVDESKSRLIYVDSCLQRMEQKLKLKDEVCISLKENLASTESEKNNLELRNQGCILEIKKLCKDNKDLNELLSSFMSKVTELDKEHASMSSHMSRLLSSFERFYEMAQEEKKLIARSSKDGFDHLQNQCVALTSENNALKIELEELKSRIIELQKTQEIVMVQHVEECQVAEDKIRRLESEAEISASNISQLEKLTSELQEKIQKLLEDSTLVDNHKQELLQKILKLESDNQELLGQVQSITEEKSNNSESMQGETSKRDQQVDTLENQINQLRSVLNEKEQLHSCSVEREKTLEDQKSQVEASLFATECQFGEAKKQYDLKLEGKRIVSKHLKELSLKNDQAIYEICKKCEREKIDMTSAEKERVGRTQQDHEYTQSTLRAYHKEELQRIQSQADNETMKRLSVLRKEHELKIKYLRMKHEEECQRMQEELELNKSKVARIQQDNEHKESTLWTYHKEEQRIESQAENEMREMLSLLRKEHELQKQSLRIRHEEECQRMQEEMELQKSKEEKQRALLQLQWQLMGENQQVDQEVNSKKVNNPDSQIETSNERITKCRERIIVRKPVLQRSFHSTASLERKNRKVQIGQAFKKSGPGNTATIVLDPDNLSASRRSYKKGIKKVRAWCRANSKPIDLSHYFGHGAEFYTTAEGGTFHLTFEFKERKLTLFLCGSTLYLKGWKGKFGTFEMKSPSDKHKPNYIPDPECTVVFIGENYHDLCDLERIRKGPRAMAEAFEVMYKCDGLITSDVMEKIATFSVNGPEAIRLEDVLEGVLESFDVYHLDLLDSRRKLSISIRTYGHYSREYSTCIECLINGKPIHVIRNRGGRLVTSLEELRRLIAVPLRDPKGKGVLESPEGKRWKNKENEDKVKEPVWCPPYADSEGWVCDEDDEE